MNIRCGLRTACALFAFVLFSGAASAQLFRAYLASDGNDANPCTLPQPCRLLPAALNSVADGGEIWMLDSANFNTATVNVTKSVSILAIPGAVGSVLAIGGPALSIVADGLTVSLRNLVVTTMPGGAGTDGVYLSGVSTLIVDGSVVANVPVAGLHVVGGRLEVANTVIRGTGSHAIRLFNGARGQVSSSKLLSNARGIYVWTNGTVTTTTSRAVISDSVISGGVYGVSCSTSGSGVGTGNTSRVDLIRTTIDGGTNGVITIAGSSNPATISLSASTITNTQTAWSVGLAGAEIESFGNNHFSGNAGSTGVLTPVTPQ